jgi:hypothetical protein
MKVWETVLRSKVASFNRLRLIFWLSVVALTFFWTLTYPIGGWEKGSQEWQQGVCVVLAALGFLGCLGAHLVGFIMNFFWKCPVCTKPFGFKFISRRCQHCKFELPSHYPERDERDLRLQLMLRGFDRIWLVVGAITGILFAVFNYFLPKQGWLTFGASMLCILSVCWLYNRRREIARCQNDAGQETKPPQRG